MTRGRPPAPIITKACEGCGEDFVVKDTPRGHERRFCGRTCSNRGTAATRGARYRAEHGYVPPTCPCGKSIEAVAKSGYAYSRKYCSVECRTRYQPVPQRDPEKWGTYTCQRPSCGKIFERRKASRNAKLYCSIACSNKMTKTRRFYAVEDFDLVFESSYEAFFWGACMVAKVPIERFDREHGVPWSVDTEDGWYAPDFWLPRHGVAVETKGLPDGFDAVRWAEFRASGRKLLVLDRDTLATVSPAQIETILALEFGLAMT